MKNPKIGDRVKYGHRRGTIITHARPGLVGVKWDDVDLSYYDHDSEYREHVRNNGEWVSQTNLEQI